MDIHMLCHRNHLQLYTIGELQSAVGDIKQHSIFVHAINGCDTISVPYMKGKTRALEVLRSFGDQDSLSTFTEPRSKCRRKVLAKVVWSRQTNIAGQTWLHPIHSISQWIISVIRVQP